MEQQDETETAQIAATRSRALSLLKSKMRRGCGTSDRHKTAPSLGRDRQKLPSPACDVDGLVEADAVERTSRAAATLEPPSADCCPASVTSLSDRLSDCDDSQEETIAQLKQRMTCERECIPIREESRCLCGHRYKEHPAYANDPRVKNKAAFRAFACTSSKCACRAFFYVVAEGAWILRCRCKHKHVEHDPSGKPFRCTKAKCGCSAFDSPWICNCDHPWAAHAQEVVEKEFRALELFQEQFRVQELSSVQRTDLVAEPLGATGCVRPASSSHQPGAAEV